MDFSRVYCGPGRRTGRPVARVATGRARLAGREGGEGGEKTGGGRTGDQAASVADRRDVADRPVYIYMIYNIYNMCIYMGCYGVYVYIYDHPSIIPFVLRFDSFVILSLYFPCILQICKILVGHDSGLHLMFMWIILDLGRKSLTINRE